MAPLILLVDDFSDAREMYEEYLTFRGLRVVTADSGPSAMLLAGRADRPTLILMDLEMRGMSGTTTMHLMRKDPRLADVPIVAFTAHALENERCNALLEGFDAVISKPCLPDELVALIEPYLTLARDAAL